jgi:hypothetical protein
MTRQNALVISERSVISKPVSGERQAVSGKRREETWYCGRRGTGLRFELTEWLNAEFNIVEMPFKERKCWK